MAKLAKADVVRVAELAKLSLTDSEIEKFLPQLSSIVEYIGQLSSVDTQAVEPTSQTTGLENVFRKDDALPSRVDQDAALSGTGSYHNGYFQVDAILAERSDK